jgi:hypothetical protein
MLRTTDAGDRWLVEQIPPLGRNDKTVEIGTATKPYRRFNPFEFFKLYAALAVEPPADTVAACEP